MQTADLQAHTQVNFEVTAPLEMGLQLMVRGNCPRLGKFNLQKGLRLFTTPTDYPVWRNIENVVIPSDVEVTYSYIVLSGGVAETDADEVNKSCWNFFFFFLVEVVLVLLIYNVIFILYGE